jgi:glucose-6-phosphate isomerase
MAARALAPDCDGPRAHFLSNVDGAHFTDLAARLDPARTLVVVASKTFTTQETMTNAVSARAWLRAALGAKGDGHMAAVSTNLPACAYFGIPAERVFGFWSWVGGRYSVWSAIGLPLAVTIGAARFRAFLEGAAAIDRHFLEAPAKENLPVMMGLIGVWRRNVMGCASVAIIPYDQRLERFPAFLQQLTMESNGKRVDLEGAALPRPACPVVWGEPGTNGQHSFFQLLHQGKEIVPVDFLIAASPRESLGDHHAKLTANCLAQSAALAFGQTADEARAKMLAAGLPGPEAERLAPHRTFPGDRPSTTLAYRRLDAHTLGRLIALYEHKTFVEAAIWGLNPFDQYGVELGKEMCAGLLPAVEGRDAASFDASTRALLGHLSGLRGEG